MDQGIKRKLVGAGVLVAFALVVLPQLSPSAGDASYLSQSIPVEENIPDMNMPLPKSLSIVSSTPQSVQSIKPESIPLEDMRVDDEILKLKGFEKPVLDESGQAIVWHIQVGSFAKAKNALDLRDKLRKGGYMAFSQPSQNGEYVRVFVGPSTQKQQLEAQMLAIKRTFNLQGQLVVFDGQ